jgi:general secretion pathway protein C
MSQKTRNSKTTLGILVIALGVLGYLLFIKPTHEPIELSQELQDSFLQDDAGAALWELNRDDLQSSTAEVDLQGLEKTPLDLQLLGVVASDVKEEGSATIQSRLQIQTYFIEDQIAYTKARLVEIRNDRVILDNEGQVQVLLLQGTPTSNLGYIKGGNATAKQGENTPLSDSPEALAKRIGNRPKLLDHIVSTQPYTTNDGYRGLLISPGQNPKLFKSARFKEDDVLQQVNGHDVTTDEGLEAIQTLIPNAQTLVFSVLRGGRVIKLYLDIPSEGLTLKKN